MKIYYNDTRRKITFENKSMGFSMVKDHFLALSAHKDSYIGLIGENHELLHFYWIANNKWLVDHPVEVNTLHQQCYATKEECLVFIQKVSQDYTPSSFEGFVSVPIGEFTLDEMIAFKAEDEALLREEELPIIDTPPVVQAKPVKKPSKQNNSKPTMIMGEALGQQHGKKDTKKTISKATPPASKNNEGYFSI